MSEIPYMLENTPEEFRRVRDLAWPAPVPARYAQCDETCTVDCGHCKGAGRDAPVAADAGSGVDPAEIARQRTLGWPDMHPEDFCHTCGRPNPTWFADTVEWQTATGSTGDGGGILCPSCFCALWEQATGKTAIIWRLSIDPRSRDAAPVERDDGMPDGWIDGDWTYYS